MFNLNAHNEYMYETCQIKVFQLLTTVIYEVAIFYIVCVLIAI